MIDPGVHTTICTCTVCGKQFVGGYRARYCYKCKPEVTRQLQRERKARQKQNKTRVADGKFYVDKICPDCGAAYVGGQRSQRCPECAHTRNLAQSRINKELWKEKQKARGEARTDIVTLAEMSRLSRATRKSYGELELMSREKPEKFEELRVQYGKGSKEPEAAGHGDGHRS